MLNKKTLRFALFIVVAAIHALVLAFVAFDIKTSAAETPEKARVMKVTDLAEYSPPPVLARPAPPPPPEAADLPVVESIAEEMIETDTRPEQIVAAPGSGTYSPGEDYLPQYKLSVLPKFDDSQLAAALVYPPIALRSAIEGRVILELFVDRTGRVQQVQVIQETPQGQGFGEAAARVFTGRRGEPALVNGEPVSCRYRYPVRFRIK